MAKVLITGTSKGIGYDASLHLARAGHEVIATMRNPNVSDLAEAVARESLPVDIQVLDVNSDESVAEIFERNQDIDALINNAGILSYEAVEDEDLEKFQAVMNTNYFGVIRCTKAVLPMMRERGHGVIINVGSVAGKLATSPSAAYSSSKFALEAFSDCLAQEVTSFGVRVHLVEPGIIDTPMATTELPEARADSVYPQGRRIKAIFKFAAQGDAPVSLTSGKLQHLIENPTSRLRHHVGPDSLVFLGLRSALSDESLIHIMGAPTDREFADRYEQETAVDLYPLIENPR